MQGITKKLVSVVLAALVLFFAVCPVPVGVESFDRLRVERATATPAIAVPIVVGTALAAMGVYVAGSTTGAYEANLDAVYQGLSDMSASYSASWDSYCQEKGGFDAAMMSAVSVDGQTISLQVLSDNGFFDAAKQYSVYMVDNGQAVIGDSSYATVSGVIGIGGIQFRTISGQPSWFVAQSDAAWSDVSFVYWRTTNTGVLYSATVGSLSAVRPNDADPNLKCSGRYDFEYQNGELAHVYHYGNTVVYQSKALANDDYAWPSAIGNSEVSTGGVISSGCAAVSSAVYNGTYSAPTSTVQPFTPTAAQLESGYTNTDVVAAIEEGSVATSGILAFLTANFPILGTILTVVSGIASNVATIAAYWAGIVSEPFEWLQDWWGTLTGWWADLLDWLGTTSFGDVMGGIASGISAIPGSIAAIPGSIADVLGRVLDDILSGVLAIPGAITGVLEGVLEGVLAIPGAIADVLAAIQAGVIELVGAIEGIRFPEFPKFDTGSSGEPISIALPIGTFEGLDADLRDKVPFCYVIHTSDAINTLGQNWGSNRSFYLDVDIPNAGTIRMDGEVVLTQRIGSMDIATLFRVLITWVLCVGLLYRAYKVIERTSGGI